MGGNGYILDTNMVGHYFTEHALVLAKVNSLPDNDLLFVSAVSLGEIDFGHTLRVSGKKGDSPLGFVRF